MDIVPVLSVRPDTRRSSGGVLLRIAGCIPAFSTRGKGALGLLLSALAGASKRETPTSNLTECIEHPSSVKKTCLALKVLKQTKRLLLKGTPVFFSISGSE